MDRRAVPGIHHAIEADNEWTMALDGLRVASQAAYDRGTIDFTPIQSTKDLENPIIAAPGEQWSADTDPSKWEYRKRYFTVIKIRTNAEALIRKMTTELSVIRNKIMGTRYQQIITK
jgi:hypothetical protein